jgi:hypothetical protein
MGALIGGETHRHDFNLSLCTYFVLVLGSLNRLESSWHSRTFGLGLILHVFVFSWTAAAVINGYTLQRSKQSIVHTTFNMMAWIVI